MDSIPLVVITGQVATAAIGTDAFQEVDTTGITTGVTKHNWLVTDAEDIPRVIREAFHVATTGRPGPVLVDFPKDVANAKMTWHFDDQVDLPGYKPVAEPDPGAIEAAVELIDAGAPPGPLRRRWRAQGRRHRGASRASSRRPDIPVVTTLMARGAFPDSDPRCLGMPGMHGTATPR